MQDTPEFKRSDLGKKRTLPTPLVPFLKQYRRY